EARVAATTQGEFGERFEVLRRLGEGGMGVVYEAFDRERQTHVALKTIRFPDAATVFRFKQEFRALADVVHPNLAALYELVSAAGQTFFTMELVSGVDFLEHVHFGADVPFAETVTSSTGSSGEVQAAPKLDRLLACDVERLRDALPQLARGIA